MADRKTQEPNEIDAAPMATTAEVAAVVQNVHRKRKSRIRWSIGQHTAELALRALETAPKRPRPRPSTKSRRRKRHKRLL